MEKTLLVRHRTGFGVLLLLVAFLFIIPGESLALSLDSAKDQGLVGEKLDGYLGIVVQNPSTEVEALVKEINSKRMQEYQSIAGKNGTDLKTVELLAGKKAVEKTRSGHFIKLPTGVWEAKF